LVQEFLESAEGKVSQGERPNVTSQRTKDLGFTLVELMVVVVITGMLASVALPAFSRYVKKARTAEAPGHLNSMWNLSITYFEREVTIGGMVVSHMFPGAAAAQEPECCLQDGEICPGNSFMYEVDPVWKALGFSIPDNHRFRPTYESAGVDLTATFTADARADLDCDTLESEYLFVGRYDAVAGEMIRTGTSVTRPLE
jgi:prepilin-type N-terminal cleavage/methylation domain-containing protein